MSREVKARGELVEGINWKFIGDTLRLYAEDKGKLELLRSVTEARDQIEELRYIQSQIELMDRMYSVSGRAVVVIEPYESMF